MMGNVAVVVDVCVVADGYEGERELCEYGKC